MKTQALRDKTLRELEAEIQERKRRLFNLRFQRATGQLDKIAELRKARREVARAMTVAAEKAREERR
ncbi:MAG: 50S ribosomal protein L29 [Candidatus Bipolaricaulota bacterium]